MLNVLEQNCVLGTYTNSTLYIGKLKESIDKFIPNIPFITYMGEGPVNLNMGYLREEFLKSGKRYAIYCDHDIVFLNPDIIRNALITLVSNKCGMVTVYSSHNPEYLTKPYNNTNLVTTIIPWSIGYFLGVDLKKVGHIKPNMELPNPNYAEDVDFSVQVRMAGYDIVCCNDYVYHLKKGNPQHDETSTRITDEYFVKKYGQFYRDVYKPINVNLA